MQPDDTAPTRRREPDETARTRPSSPDATQPTLRQQPPGEDPTVQRPWSRPPGPPAPPAPVAQAPGDLTGEILSGKYRVVRLLGKGGFGAVYEAKDEMLGASVAVKVLTPAAAEQEDALQQFLGEARLLTSLDHANIVRWITFDRTASGLHYFVMEFLRGAELSKILTKAGRLPHERATAILLQVLGALRAAHFLPDGRSLLHLDLKPQNVFITDTDPEQVKVIDFGISQHVGAAARSAAGIGADPGARPDTDLGATIATISSPADQSWMVSQNGVQRARGGTLLYASPEQCKHLRGDPVIDELDGRSDIYSLGVMAFQLLAGRLPWEARTQKEAYKAHLETPAPPLSKFVKVPRALEQFVARCLAKNRDERFKDVREAYDALDEVVHPPSKWPRFVGAGALVAGLAIWQLWPDPPRDEVDVTAPNGTLYFGPARRSVTAPIAKLLPEATGGQLAFVTDPRSEDTVLPGWSVRLDRDADGQCIRIDAPGTATEVVDAAAYVRFGGDGVRQHSKQKLRFVYLPEKAVGIGSTGVRDAKENHRAIDPVGAKFDVELRAPRDHVAAVQAVLGEQVRNATLDESRSGQVQVFVVPLDEFGFTAADGERTAAFQIVVVDRAGNEQRRPVPLQIDARPLEFATAKLDLPADRPDFWVLGPTVTPKLQTRLNRSAEVTFVARDAQGKTIDVTRAPAGDDVALTFPPAEQAYGGSIEVLANDLGAVFHADDARGRASRTLRFRFETKSVTVEIRPRHTDGGALAESRTKGTFLTNRDGVSLDLVRKEVAVSVEVECRREGADPWTATKDLHGEGLQTVNVPLAEGRQEVTVRGYRYSGSLAERTATPEFVQTLVFVRDTTKPTLVVATAPSPIGRALAPTAPCCALDVGDDSGEPMTLAWRLEGPTSKADSLVLETGMRRDEPLPWSRLGVDPASLEDGAYTLRFTAVDAAGNRHEGEPLSFDVAWRGPSLRLISPDGNDWTATTGATFQVKVAAHDENGVAAVVCTVRREDTGEALPPMDLRRTGTDEKSGEWIGQFEPPSGWAEKQVVVAWTGRDRSGNERAEQTRTSTLQAFRRQRPTRIWHEVLAAKATTQAMREVRGEPNYVFGGRNEDEEIALLGDFGIEGPRARIGRCTAERILVDDFYLDENEVTVGEFGRFVDSGYMEPTHWTARDGRGTAAAPVAARRDELRRAIAASSPSLPITGIDWYEASAYAHWAGKRLPTKVEWEYAVRGGTAYRPFSCAVSGRELPEWNIGTPGGGAWDVGRGGDETPRGLGQGLRNLCSNVMEWTSSPSDDPARMQAAGACFDDIAFHFRKVTPLEPSQRRPTLGFRCAASASEVDAQLEKVGRTRIHSTDPAPDPKAR